VVYRSVDQKIKLELELGRTEANRDLSSWNQLTDERVVPVE
jgi:hypothetical protein